MKKLKLIRNVLTLFAVLATVVFISCDAFFENEQNVTINLPPISSSARAISSDKISDLKNVTTSYRVTANGITREGTGGSYTFTLPVGVVAEITVECLNSSGNVIVRAKKTHTVTAGTNNVDINLSRDGDVVGTGGGPSAPQPVPGKVAYNGNGADSGTPSDTQTYDTGNEVTLQTGEPSRAGYEFAGWTSNVELKYDDAGQEQTIPLGVEFASGGSNVATNIKIANFKMPEGGVVLTAKWTPVTYNITYNDTNGGTGSADTANATTSFNIETQTITFAAEGTLEKIAYQFDGWETSNGTDVRGMNAAQLIALITSGDTLALRAKWIDGKRTVLYESGLFVINELPANRKTDATKTVYEAMKDDGSNYVFSSNSNSLWYDNRDAITSVEIGSNISPTSTAYWFYLMSNCISMNLTNLDTSNVTNMEGMFKQCSGLTSLDVSKFDTSNVTTMSDMFNSCSKLTSLDLSNFVTSNVTNMDSMFKACSELTSLDVSKFDTSNVTDMDFMFFNCSGLTRLDVSKFDTSKVTSMGNMFQICSGLTSLNVSSFNTSKVTYITSMFQNCSKLTSLDLSNFDTSNVTRIDSLFSNCSGLTSLDVSNFDTSKVTDMSNMFNGCSKLATIYASSSFVTTSVTDDTDMFANCTALRGGQNTTYDASNVDKDYARIDGGTANPGYFTDIADKP